jgi:hypothetical protein
MRIARHVMTVCALALAWCIGIQSAHAQAVPRPGLIDCRYLVNGLADAQVPVTPSQFIVVYQAYLDRYENLYWKADAELARIREQSKTAPGTYLGARELRQVLEAESTALTEHLNAVDLLAEELKAMVSADLAARVDSIAQLVRLRLYCDQFRYQGFMRAQDISMALTVGPAAFVSDFGAMSDADRDEIRRQDASAARAAVFEAKLDNLEGRMRASQALWKAANEMRLDQAKRMEAAGFVGKTQDDLSREMSAGWESARGLQGQELQAEIERIRERQRVVESLRIEAPVAEQQEFVRQQLVALRACESTFTPWQQAHMLDSWLPALGNMSHQMYLPGPDGQSYHTPRDAVQALLRIRDLSDEQRAKVRALGREFIIAERKLIRQSVEKFAESGVREYDYSNGHTLVSEHMRRLGDAVGQALISAEDDSPSPGLSKVPLADDLSKDDANEFGQVMSGRQEPANQQRARALMQLEPAPPSERRAEILALQIGVPADLRSVLEVLVADAQAEWDAQVKPMRQKLEAKWDYELSVSRDPQAAWLAEQKRAADARVEALRLCAAVDQRMFDSLRAALPPGASHHALALAEILPRVEECLGTQWSARPGNRANVITLVLDAPVADSTRALLVQELAQSAAQWRELASKMLQAQLARFILNQSGAAWEVQQGNATSDAAKQAAAVQEQLTRATESWKAAESEAIHRLTALVPPSELPAWDSWVKTARWPQIYPELLSLERAAHQALMGVESEDEIRAKVDAQVQSTRSAIGRSGDRALAVMQAERERPPWLMDWDPTFRELELRLRAPNACNQTRRLLAFEAVCMLLPPQCARSIPGGRTLERLARPAEVSVQAPAP